MEKSSYIKFFENVEEIENFNKKSKSMYPHAQVMDTPEEVIPVYFNLTEVPFVELGRISSVYQAWAIYYATILAKQKAIIKDKKRELKKIYSEVYIQERKKLIASAPKHEVECYILVDPRYDNAQKELDIEDSNKEFIESQLEELKNSIAVVSREITRRQIEANAK